MSLEIGLCTFADLGNLTSQQRLANLLEEAELADRLSLDVIAVGEHHRSDYVVSAPPVALAAIAARTKHIRLSSGVTVLSSDDPVRVFQQFATVDALSGGRAEIMAGRGSFIESFPLFGYELNDYDALFSEKLELLVKLTREERVTWNKGKHTQVLNGVTVYPRPVQWPLPVWVAVGGTPESVVRAAHYALPLTIAIIGGEWERFAPFVQLYKRALSAAHGAEALPQVCITQHCYIAEDARQARDEFFPYHNAVFQAIGRERGWAMPSGARARAEFDRGCGPDGHLLVGSPEEIIAKLRREHAVFGNTRFLAQTSLGTLPHAGVLKSIELLGTVVAPALKA